MEIRTPAALDEVGPDGVSAAEAFAGVTGDFADLFVYRDTTETPIAVSVALVSAEQVTYELVAGEDPNVCWEPFLLAHFDMTVATGDGAFDEAFPFAAIAAEVATALPFNVYLDGSALGGTYVGKNMRELSVNGTVRSDGTTAGELVELRAGDADPGSTATSTSAPPVECGIGAWNGPLFTGCD